MTGKLKSSALLSYDNVHMGLHCACTVSLAQNLAIGFSQAGKHPHPHKYEPGDNILLSLRVVFNMKD